MLSVPLLMRTEGCIKVFFDMHTQKRHELRVSLLSPIGILPCFVLKYENVKEQNSVLQQNAVLGF